MSIALTLAVLGTWIVIAVGLSAIGALFLNRLQSGEFDPTWFHLYCTVWAGFALLIASLMIWHFFLPVNDGALIAFASLAALALIVERDWFRSVLRIPFNRAFAVVVSVFALWTANHALVAGGMDDYVYEYQTIRWFHEYPLVPGLANLHGRLGFNNSHHLFAAMLSVGLWRGAVNHIFNGFFVVLASVLLLYAVRDLARGTERSLERSLFPALLVCPCIGLVWFSSRGPMISTLKADVFVGDATAVLACLFLRWATAARSNTRPSVLLSLTAITLLVGAVVTSVKMSAVTFCGFIVVIVALRSFRQFTLAREHKRLLTVILVLAALAISALIREAVLTGYPLYPLTAFRLNVDWRVPVAQAEAEHAFITSFARLQPSYDPANLPGWSWVREWTKTTATRESVNIVLPLVLTLACLPLLFAPRRKGPHVGSEGAPPEWAYATLASASVASLIVWFLQAPAGRFVIVNFWILFAAVFSWGVQRQRGGWVWSAPLIGLLLTLPGAAFVLFYYLRISADQSHMLVLLIFAALWIVLFGLLRTANPRLIAAPCILLALYQYGERSEVLLRGRRYAELKPMLWVDVRRLPDPMSPATSLRETRSGLKIYETSEPDFETPLPNTRFFNPFLQLRTARLKDGFRNAASGNSSAHYWENPYRSLVGYECEASGGYLDSYRLIRRDSKCEKPCNKL